MLRGVRKGEREVLFAPAPPWIFNILMAFAPQVIDRVVLKQWEKIARNPTTK